MTPERWRRIRDVLEPALDVPGDALEEWLDGHCDHELRDEVQALIDAASDDDSLLDTPAFRPDAVLSPGAEIGPYVVDSLIGVGGMGVVYRAHDPRLQRTVAIKMISFGGQETEMLSEARAASALDHPNIVVIHDILQYRDTPAIVMEYVDGDRLDERLDKGPLAPTEVGDYGQQIAAAIAASHEAGVLHRDLKPANIIVRPDGVVKVLDFGIAHRLPEGGARDARPGGTSGYAAPEQIAGQRLDARADVYSFGAVLRDMLCGDARDDDSVPPRWQQCLEKCLAVDPANRFSGMREVEACLAALAPSRRARWPVPRARS